MAYIAANYLANPNAPFGKWVCTRTSNLRPFETPPPASATASPNFCGQCVSFVTTVCVTLPVRTSEWKKGVQVKGAKDTRAGTAIATFNPDGNYSGHAAIYESQSSVGINVVEQWVTLPATAIHQRTLRFGAHGISNNGDNFFVID